ncbi:hypothetical protein ACKUB1_16560 [Methanospirillum stamsii]|uniref:DUF83 domain-containing protein n=1 Tax=Methanospirillum stamsii TaxID=1277351 RepID=A0A2V2N5A5_9EURY|nr:hypothetical protein [Methanospirillum stamsii]PWR74999.1 hypothetical protein DLD82_07190 [Methanospirillum stamsii]
MTASLSGKKNHPEIAISSLIRAFHCPRQYYFLKNTEWKSSEKYSICKQISVAEKDADEENIWNTICMIHPDISPDKRPFLTSCLQAMITAPVRPWTDLDITVHSNKLHLYGLLDKYDAGTGECTLTRCTPSPKTGCWPEDRIRAAALLLCIWETGNGRPSGIYIEYIPSGIIRYYEPSPRDKRQVLLILRQIQKIENGEFPPKPMKPPCSWCRFEEKCKSHEPRRLSGLFKK